MNQQNLEKKDLFADDEANETATLSEKLLDALTPGLQVEFDPDEAMKAGAFIEDAITEEDAIESCFDVMDFINTDTKGTKEKNAIDKE